MCLGPWTHLISILLVFLYGTTPTHVHAGSPSFQYPWAYPQGVLVSVQPHNWYWVRKGQALDDGKKVSHPQWITPWHQLTRRSADTLASCASLLRKSNPSLGPSRKQFRLLYEITVTGDGQIQEVLPKAPLPPLVVECVARGAQEFFKPKKGLPPTSENTNIYKTNILFTIRFLDDQEAQGPSYQKAKGEYERFQLIQMNPQWTSCRKKSDCSLIYSLCQILAVSPLGKRQIARLEFLSSPCPSAGEIYDALCKKNRCEAHCVRSCNARELKRPGFL